MPSCLDLSATAEWAFDADIRDESGPVDMTGLDIVLVMSTKNGAEVARAATADGSIQVVTGPTGLGRSRLQVTIPPEGHAALVVTHGFVMIEGDIGVLPGPSWLGKKEFRVLAGPAWTGATGA